MPCNLSRWNWLIQGTYNGLSPYDRENVMTRFFNRVPRIECDSFLTEDDAEDLYQIMIDLGIKIKGTDPNPPKTKIILPTTPGAEEYDQIMIDLESVGL